MYYSAILLFLLHVNFCVFATLRNTKNEGYSPSLALLYETFPYSNQYTGMKHPQYWFKYEENVKSSEELDTLKIIHPLDKINKIINKIYFEIQKQVSAN